MDHFDYILNIEMSLQATYFLSSPTLLPLQKFERVPFPVARAYTEG